MPQLYPHNLHSFFLHKAIPGLADNSNTIKSLNQNKAI
jgi:hypothetical protein